MAVIDILRSNFDARKTVQAELRSIDEKCTTENRPYNDDENAKIVEFRSQLEAIDERIQANIEIEVRSQQIDGGMDKFLGVIADRESGEVVDTRSIGERFVTDTEFRSWALAGARGQHGMDFDGMDFRAVTDTTSGTTSGGAFGRAERLGRIGRDFLDRRVYLLDLLPHIGTQNSAVEYVQDKSPLADMADKAAETSEAGSKPQAGITAAVVTEAMATIPAWVNLTRQAAADFPQVQGYLDGRLRYSLKRRADKQSINGDGSAPNLKGLLNRSSILTNAPGSSEARFITIRHAITVMENAEAVPEIIVLNPADAELFDLTNSASAGVHAVDADSGLVNGPTRTAWGLTQVHSTAIASGTAMLIDPMAISVVDRQAPTAYMTDSHASNFTSNILTLLLELRMGLALFDPSGVCKVTFNGTT